MLKNILEGINSMLNKGSNQWFGRQSSRKHPIRSVK